MVITLVYVSIFVHEFGHIAACSRFGIRHGGVGFGFYLFLFPVLYADVTNIWQANRELRIITNLGGIYSQLLYAGLLTVGYMLTQYAPLLVAALATTAAALWQFNPFVRHDGYWLLSDLTNTPNLLQKASQVTRRGLSRQGLRQVMETKGKVLLNKRIFLFLYGLANPLIIIVIAGLTVMHYGDELIKFPALVLALSTKLITGTLVLADVRQVPLVVLTFYAVIARYLFALLLKSRMQRTVEPLVPQC